MLPSTRRTPIEVAYHKALDDALSKTLIPDAQNAELKSLLENGLKLFQDQLERSASAGVDSH